MKFLGRAFKNVTRSLSKSVLLALTFFLIGNLVILGLGITQAATNAKTLTRSKMNPVVNFEVDYDSFFKYVNTLDESEQQEAYKNFPRLKSEVVETLAKDERVSVYNTGLSAMGTFANGIKNVPLGNEEMQANAATEGASSVGGYVYKPRQFKIMSNNAPDFIEFHNKTFSIVDGRMFDETDIASAKEVILITDELAKENNLSIGDKLDFITIYDNFIEENYPDNKEEGYKKFTHSFEIIGIYKNTNTIDKSNDRFKYMDPWESPQNLLLMPKSTLVDINYNEGKLIREAYLKTNPEYFENEAEPTKEDYDNVGTVTYLLKNSLEIDSFVKENQGKLDEYTKLNANDQQFKEISKPLDTLGFFSNIIVWIVTINAIVIISLVTALTLKTREYEIGVLLSVGVSKIKVVLQLFSELILVALLGFSLAVFSGSLVAGKVGDKVLDYTKSKEEVVEKNEFDHMGYGDSDYFTHVTQDELLDEYKVSVSPILILEIYTLGLGVVFISILIPSIMIMRLNPKQILLSTN